MRCPCFFFMSTHAYLILKVSSLQGWNLKVLRSWNGVPLLAITHIPKSSISSARITHSAISCCKISANLEARSIFHTFRLFKISASVDVSHPSILSQTSFLLAFFSAFGSMVQCFLNTLRARSFYNTISNKKCIV